MSTGNLIIEGNVVKGLIGKSTHLVIPEGITEIGEAAFENCTWINEVTIDSSVFSTIGTKAFSGCSSLGKITIKSLRGGIGSAAFYNCSQLGSIDIPEGAIEIGSNAFGFCPELYLVRIPHSVIVIAEDAFSIITSPRLLIICKPNTEAEKYAEKHTFPYRDNLEFEEICRSLELANIRRECVGVRTFKLFGQSVDAHNSMALKEGIIEYYKKKEDVFFNLIISRFPKHYGDKFDASKISQDLLQFASETVKRLEKHGVYTTQLRVLQNASQIIATLTSTIKSVSEIIGQLTSIRNSHLNDRLGQLRSEAESKVTGLSYGVIGDSLTLAAHAVDDFRERQKQRKHAYAAAQRQFDEETAQTNATISERYKTIFKDDICPIIRKLTSAYVNLLCVAEIEYLITYGLMGDVDLSVYDAQKSSEILAHSADLNAEYAIGLALKTYPLNTKAMVHAGVKNYATDELLDYIAFMGIADKNVIREVLRSEKISLSALVRFHKHAVSNEACEAEIKIKIDPIREKIDTLACGTNEYATEQDVQKLIGDLIDCELWVAVNQIMPLLSETTQEKLGLTQDETSAEQGYASLGQRIYAYNERWSQADAQAVAVASSDVSIQEKTEELYELREILGAQRLKQLLQNDLIRVEEEILRGPLPEYTGLNFEEIRQTINRNIEKILGYDTAVKLTSIYMDGSDTSWADELNLQYVNAEQDKYVQRLEDKLKATKDYREAFDIAKDYAWRTKRNELRELMKEYTDAVTNQIRQLADTIDLPESAKESDAKDLSTKALHKLMEEECWIVYYLCAFTADTDFNRVKDHLGSSVYADTELAIRNEIIYRDACAAAKTAKNVNAVQSAKSRFKEISGNYKDSATKLAECEIKLIACARKKKARTTWGIISAVVAVAAILVLLFTQIIPNNKYNDAVALMDTGNYADAITAFKALNGYKDSTEKMQQCTYITGTNLVEEGKYAEAYIIFNTISSYKDSADIMTNLEIEYPHFPILCAEVGDIVTFGNYEQNNNMDDGAEKIEWIVLSKESTNVVLLSKYVLDAKPYESYEAPLLTNWLPIAFGKKAFNDAEMKAVRSVGLLSVSEAKAYNIKELGISAAKYTSYANAQDPDWGSRFGLMWWLADRSNGDHAHIVDENGWFGQYICNVDENVGVRPKLVINIA